MSDHGSMFVYCVANNVTLDADAEQNFVMSVDRDGRHAVARTGKRTVFSSRLRECDGRDTKKMQ